MSFATRKAKEQAEGNHMYQVIERKQEGKLGRRGGVSWCFEACQIEGGGPYPSCWPYLFSCQVLQPQSQFGGTCETC